MDEGKVQQVSFETCLRSSTCVIKHVEVSGSVAFVSMSHTAGRSTPSSRRHRWGSNSQPQQYSRLIDCGRRIKHAVMAQFPIEHPFESDLSFLYGTIFTAPARAPGHHSRNVTVFAEGEVDRSATGSGVSARAALHHAKGELGFDEKIRIESILDSTMSVRVNRENEVRSLRCNHP